MKKWMIGLILAIMGVIIMTATILTFNPLAIISPENHEPERQLISLLSFIIGTLLILFGAIILGERFKIWIRS